MPEALMPGPPTLITQNTIYALPASKCVLFSDAAGATFFQSNTEAFTASVAVTLVDGMSQLAGAFLRCTSASPGYITVKKA